MSELFLEALDLAMYGMGTVFAFLTLLVVLTTLMSKLVMRFGAGEVEAVQAPPVARTSQGPSPALLAAAAAAVRQHRAEQAKQK